MSQYAKLLLWLGREASGAEAMASDVPAYRRGFWFSLAESAREAQRAIAARLIAGEV